MKEKEEKNEMKEEETKLVLRLGIYGEIESNILHFHSQHLSVVSESG